MVTIIDIHFYVQMDKKGQPVLLQDCPLGFGYYKYTEFGYILYLFGVSVCPIPIFPAKAITWARLCICNLPIIFVI